MLCHCFFIIIFNFFFFILLPGLSGPGPPFLYTISVYYLFIFCLLFILIFTSHLFFIHFLYIFYELYFLAFECLSACAFQNKTLDMHIFSFQISAGLLRTFPQYCTKCALTLFLNIFYPIQNFPLVLHRVYTYSLFEYLLFHSKLYTKITLSTPTR